MSGSEPPAWAASSLRYLAEEMRDVSTDDEVWDLLMRHAEMAMSLWRFSRRIDAALRPDAPPE